MKFLILLIGLVLVSGCVEKEVTDVEFNIVCSPEPLGEYVPNKTCYASSEELGIVDCPIEYWEILQEQLQNCIGEKEDDCPIKEWGLGIELRIKSNIDNESKDFSLYLDDKFIGNFSTEYDNFYGWHKHFSGNQAQYCEEKYTEGLGYMCLGKKLAYKTKIRIEYDNKTLENVFGCYQKHQVMLE